MVWLGPFKLTETEFRIALAVRSFLAEFPGQWLSEHVLFPDRKVPETKGWSVRKNRLSALCRWHLMRARSRGALRWLKIDCKPGRGCFMYRWPRKAANHKTGQCVLDRLLGERR